VPVTLTARVVDANSREVFSNAELFAPDRFTSVAPKSTGEGGTARAADVRIDLPLSRLQAGPHLLTIEARASDRVVTTRHVPFEVR
jgi:hypothetical protein